MKEVVSLVTMEPGFRAYTAKLASDTSPSRGRAWTQCIELRYSGVLEEIVWGRLPSFDTAVKRRKLVNQALRNLRPSHGEILRSFEKFRAVLKRELSLVRVLLGDLDTPLHVIAGLSFGTFNGLLLRPAAGRPRQLYVGVDTIVLWQEKLHVVLAHELAHAFHHDRMGDGEIRHLTADGRLTLALWLEGFAAWLTGKTHPRLGTEEILMSRELGQLGHEDVAALASAFLDVANEPAMDFRRPDRAARWFVEDPFSPPGLPRPGYRLGLEVVRFWESRESVEKLCRWKRKEIHGAVIEALRSLAGTRRAVSARWRKSGIDLSVL